ncbi:MAG: DUF2520 domain-containing protein [Candidatus Pseudobacter hemicellulosilyticus]|uniref:DUF2520 domain-containing protein n=1 Tax=Candidatus Pseudobacter hemicellulosilyticus TaxID=3121375 RepID=A0AAJ5WRE6_9BACT|nr:MAG: DUF2520 domain-containing protein [Pseudobacter sp.]
MKIVILGSGNVAHVLGRKCLMAGHTLLQVYARQPEKAQSLANLLGAAPVADLQQLDPDADCYIIAVADAAIASVAAGLEGWGRPVVHTAGSVPAAVLAITGGPYGVLYPLQSLRREMDQLPEIPLLVQGSSPAMEALVSQLAHTLSRQVQPAGDEQRLRLHLAAVISSNFTNHLFALTEQYCRDQQADFRLLLPLINEVTQRLSQASPLDTQTGPAIRHDEVTIRKHLELLNGYPALKELYDQFSKSIMGMYPQ